jgi:uncharacterized protein YndB with AHSA1/START domain
VTELLIHQSIEVAAPAELLWKILTNSEFIRQYMFGCNAESDWKSGSSLLWRGAADGTLYVKGNIVSIDPPHSLVYTVFDPNSTMADIPSNYLTMTYKLSSLHDRATQLEITQGDFSKVENGQKRYQDSLGGSEILETIRTLAERQAHSS